MPATLSPPPSSNCIPRVLFVSWKNDFENAFRKHAHSVESCGVSFYVGDVQDVLRMNNKHALFVSPGNSFGWMDGGVDQVYNSRKMFPGIERKVQAAIRHVSPYRTAGGQPYLPVGSAVLVDERLVAAPTMFRPGNVSHTRNAYHAFRAVLDCVEKYARLRSSSASEYTVVCPALCCGYGLMSVSQSARQVAEAFNDYLQSVSCSNQSRDHEEFSSLSVSKHQHEQDDDISLSKYATIIRKESTSRLIDAENDKRDPNSYNLIVI